MPVYMLSDELRFPDPNLADKNGLLAVGGDLSIERLLLAYSNGIYPWYSEGEPIMWWSPDPRMILFPENLKVSKSLWQSIRNKSYEVTFDSHFERVINACANTPRKEQAGTWITGDMISAYTKLFHEGFAHSVEIWLDKNLVGGLYGLLIGKCFCGESMFHNQRDASKVALYYLIKKMKALNLRFIDAQMDTPHMRSLGGKRMPRKDFLALLKNNLIFPPVRGKW